MDKRSEKEDDPIPSSLRPSSKNAPTYNIDSFPFIPYKSMSGIFFYGSSSDDPAFNFMRPYPFINIRDPSFFSIPTPFSILSSSQGLVLCRDFIHSSYHVCNPFVRTPSSYQLVPPPPSSRSPSHGESLPPTVLSTDFRQITDLRFYIVSIVLEKQNAHLQNAYTFDMYSSHDDRWRVGIQPVVTNAPVVENTGISTADGSVYWLTEPPRQIVKYNNNGAGTSVSQKSSLPDGFRGSSVKVQLGRMGSVGVSLVALRENELVLFLVRDGFTDTISLEALCCLDVSAMFSPEKIELLRFEKEVALWVEGRIVFWTPSLDHLNDNDGRIYGETMHRMPEWVNVPRPICDTIPYVHTGIVPRRSVEASSGDVISFGYKAGPGPLSLMKSYSGAIIPLPSVEASSGDVVYFGAGPGPLSLMKSHSDKKVISDHGKNLPVNMDISCADVAKTAPLNLNQHFFIEDLVDSDDADASDDSEDSSTDDGET